MSRPEEPKRKIEIVDKSDPRCPAESKGEKCARAIGHYGQHGSITGQRWGER